MKHTKERKSILLQLLWTQKLKFIASGFLALCLLALFHIGTNAQTCLDSRALATSDGSCTYADIYDLYKLDEGFNDNETKYVYIQASGDVCCGQILLNPKAGQDCYTGESAYVTGPACSSSSNCDCSITGIGYYTPGACVIDEACEGNQTFTIGNHSVEFMGWQDNGSSSIWYYKVTSGRMPSISHLTFGLFDCQDCQQCEFEVDCPELIQGTVGCDFTLPEVNSVESFEALGGEITACTDNVMVSAEEKGSICRDQIGLLITVKDGDEEETCEVRWNVELDDLDITCPPVTRIESCTDQAQINQAFRAWLSDYEVTGACGRYRVTTNPARPILPSICSGGRVEVTFTVTDECQRTATCSSVFGVQPPPPVMVECPADVMFGPCKTQEEVDMAFTRWLDAFDAEGGCDLEIKYAAKTERDGDGFVELDARPNAPDACGGWIQIRMTAQDQVCPDNKDRCFATFTVKEQDPVSVDCPVDVMFGPCKTQEEVDMAFSRWLNAFEATGGCDLEIKYAAKTERDGDGFVELDVKPDAPDACGGWIQIRMTAIDRLCPENKDRCFATFTVKEQDPVMATCPGDAEVGPCLNQDEVNAKFDEWLAGFTAKGGCNRMELLYMDDGDAEAFVQGEAPVAPNYCGGYVMVKFSVFDLQCLDNADECTATFRVKEQPAPEWKDAPGDIYLACNEEPEPSYIYATQCEEMVMVKGTLDPITDRDCDGYVYERWEYTGRCGQTISHKRKVHYKFDTERPVIHGVPAALILKCGSDLPAWPSSVYATDNCKEPVNLSRVQLRAYNPCGSIRWERVWTAVDECGNKTVRKQYIYFSDDVDPVLEVPEDMVLECPDEVPEPTYTAYDDCSEIKVTFDEKRVDHNDCEFTITRTWTVRDACGNEVSKSQKIEYIDNTPPVITPVNPMLVGLPVGGEMSMYTCDDPQIQMGDVIIDECCLASSEAKDELVSTGMCDLRGYWRKWKCSVTAVDGAGNKAEYYFYVLQYDTTAPQILNVPEDLALTCEDTVPPPAMDVETKDDCILPRAPQFSEEVVYDPADSSNYAVIRTWTAEDDCGNSSEADQVITVCDFDLALLDNSVGNSVWLDANGNGVQEAEEVGISGVEIRLYEVKHNADGDIITALATTTSDEEGKYSFTGLTKGAYQVEFVAPDDYDFTLAYQEGDLTNSDADPITGMTEVTILGYADHRMDLDAGFVSGATDVPPALNSEVNGTDDIADSEINVFPNPVLQRVTVDFTMDENSEVRFDLYDQLGRIVYTQKEFMNKGQQRSEIEMGNLPAGVYMLSIHQAQKVHNKMLIKN